MLLFQYPIPRLLEPFQAYQLQLVLSSLSYIIIIIIIIIIIYSFESFSCQH